MDHASTSPIARLFLVDGARNRGAECDGHTLWRWRWVHSLSRSSIPNRSPRTALGLSFSARENESNPKHAVSLLSAVGTRLEPGNSFSKVPKTFRARKAICEIVNRLFWKTDPLTCFQGNKNKNNCEVWRIKCSPFLSYKGNCDTRKWPPGWCARTKLGMQLMALFFNFPAPCITRWES